MKEKMNKKGGDTLAQVMLKKHRKGDVDNLDRDINTLLRDFTPEEKCAMMSMAIMKVLNNIH